MGMKLYVVRHGQTNYNLRHLCNDDPRVDVHLTDLGEKQSQEVAKQLKSVEFAKVLISELPRTRQTAEIITQGHDLPFIVDKRINDRKTGCEGKTVTEFEKALGQDLFNIKLSGGESFQEEKQRVFAFLEELKQSKENGSVLIVTHHEIVKIMVGYFNNLSDREMWDLMMENGRVVEIVI